MKFVLARDKTVASVSGRSVEFKKGQPTHVPPQMYAEVIAVGAVPEDESILDEKDESTEVPTGADRELLIRTAMEDMVTTNNREEFTAGGAPHCKVLSARLGFVVDPKERDLVWTKLQQEED